MDELLKNCNTKFFKRGDIVRIRKDIGNLAALKRTDIDRYTRIFPNPSIRKYAAEKTSCYCIQNEMQCYAGELATVTDVLLHNHSSLLSARYNLHINYGDGSSKYSDYDWRHALLEKVKEKNDDFGGSTRFPLKVGDVVTVRRDIAEKCDEFGYIWSTVNEQKVESPVITNSMICMAGEIGTITNIYHYGDFIYELKFQSSQFSSGFFWSINCFEEFQDYKAYAEGNDDKKKAPQKKS